MNIKELLNSNVQRLLMQATLKPQQGNRFQPTGFPDLGATTYTEPTGNQALIVESEQSMANRFEKVCWDEQNNNWVQPLKGLPAVMIQDVNSRPLTNSVLEAHRFASPYILEANDKSFVNEITSHLNGIGGAIEIKNLTSLLLKYDINSLIHGVFIAKSNICGGRMRIERALTGFIEATNISRVNSGGVKNDRVKPSKGEEGQTSQEGFGNIPFHREAFTGDITAYFNVDMAQIRGYGFKNETNELLVALALYKIQAMLQKDLRLRSACDLTVCGELMITKPKEFKMPSLNEIEQQLPDLIIKNYENTSDRFKTVTYEKKADEKKKDSSKVVEDNKNETVEE